MPAIFREYRPGFFLDNGIPNTTQVYQHLIEVVIAAGSQLLEASERRISLGDVVLHVLPAPGVASWGHNDNSVGVIVEYGEFRASLLGDAGQRQQDWLVNTAPNALTRVQVHKASHHGSANGDTADLMQRLSPEVVIVSAGVDNRYGHPAASALALYASVGATVFRTDLHGSLIVHGNADGTFTVSSHRPAHPAAAANGCYWH